MMANDGRRINASKAMVVTLTLLLGLTTAALMGEWIARAAFPHWAPGTGVLTLFWKHDPSLGWSHIPNSKGSFRSYGFEALVSINSKGFRDIERSYERDPSKYRIVVMGDSMVWGWGVQQDELFTALIEQKQKDVEVINLAVSGYGTDQEFLLLRQEAVRYRPDLIVVVVMDNDFDTNVQKELFLGYQKPMFELRENGHLVLTNTPVPERSLWLKMASWPVRRSYILNQAARAYQQFTRMLASSKEQPLVSDRSRSFPGSVKEALTTALLFEIQREARKINADLVLVLTDRLGKHGIDIENYFRSHHIAILNLDPFFPKDQYNELHLPDRVHWTRRGHRIVAGSLLAYLKDENFLAKTFIDRWGDLRGDLLAERD